jgi:Sortase (surface protein transpeptidase)
MMAAQNQRVWVARHVYEWLTITLKVFYSVRYLPEFLRKLGLNFHKAVHTLIERDNEKRKKWIQETILVLYADKVDAFGQVYVYEVTESQVVQLSNIAAAFKHEEKSWLTLITCENYQDKTETYANRRLVRAVLVSVVDET